MSRIQVWPLIEAMDHIRAHMQTQQNVFNALVWILPFSFRGCFCAIESLRFLLYSLRATSHARLCRYLSSTLLLLLWQLMQCLFLRVLLCISACVNWPGFKKIHQFSRDSFYRYFSNNWIFRHTHKHRQYQIYMQLWKNSRLPLLIYEKEGLGKDAFILYSHRNLASNPINSTR